MTVDRGNTSRAAGFLSCPGISTAGKGYVSRRVPIGPRWRRALPKPGSAPAAFAHPCGAGRLPWRPPRLRMGDASPDTGKRASEAVVPPEDSAEGQRLRPSSEPRWYMVQTTPGLEDNVVMTLEAKLKNTPTVANLILDALVPKVKVMHLTRSGERSERYEKLFPGYVMVNMILQDASWHFVRSTSYVVQFVGADRLRRTSSGSISGNRGIVQPRALSRAEVSRILQRINEGATIQTTELNFQAGDLVRVVRGSYAGREGVVTELSPGRGKAVIHLRFLGREIPTEVSIAEVEKTDTDSRAIQATAEQQPRSGSGRRVTEENRHESLEALNRLGYDWRAVAGRGGLHRMPAAALRQYCRAHGLNVAGRKNVLAERVRQHLAAEEMKRMGAEKAQQQPEPVPDAALEAVKDEGEFREASIGDDGGSPGEADA